MSLLPSAHAGQSFGSRRIDFITVSGEVNNSDADIGRVTDGDGVVHDVRLNERSSALAAGDTATVLRVQSGPNRRSRPVAIINHSRNVWMRSAQDATTILGRSGVTRALNWWLSVLALALVAIAAAWPALHSFLTEVNGAMMAGIPSIDIYAELGAQMPALASWRLETALSPGLFDGIAALGLVPMAQLTEWGLAIAVTALAIITFFARSWRLLYVPALAVLCVVSGAILGSPVATLLMVGGAVLLFIIGGFINRVRDGGRFNARVERLAEYVLRHPPEEGVRTSEPVRAEPIAPEPLAAAVAATAIAAASAVAEGDEADADAVAGSELDAVTTEPGTPAEPAQSAANGQVTARSDEPEAATEETTGPDDTEAAHVEDDEAEAELAAEGAVEPEAESASETGSEDAIDSGSEADTDADDDLPSLEAVAAAAAISDTERTGQAAAAAGAPLEDDRTMPIIAPPPMPAPAAETESVTSAPQEASEPAADNADSITATAEAEAEAADTTMATLAAAPIEAEDEPDEAPEIAAAASESGAHPSQSASPLTVEDPMVDDDHDPMMEAATGDFAPGSPEIEVDSDKTD